MTFTPPNSHSNGQALGLTGATAATRYVGATATGAPASGTFLVGDFCIDQTGKVYICTAAGSPGTWAQVGGSSSAGASNAARPTGSIMETMPRQYIGNGNRAILTSGTLCLMPIYLPAGQLVSSISFVSATQALVGGTVQRFALFDGPTAHEGGAARAMLRKTADDAATAWAANSVKTLALTAGYTTVAEGLFYVGILVAAGTVPTLTGHDLGNTVLELLAPVVNGNSNTGLTDMPAAANAPGGVSTLAYAYVS